MLQQDCDISVALKVAYPWLAEAYTISTVRLFRAKQYLIPDNSVPVVFATVINSHVCSRSDSGYSSNLEPNHCNRSYHAITRTITIGPVLPPESWYFNRSSLAPIPNVWSECIMTQSIRIMNSCMRCCIVCCDTCDLTNVWQVAIKNLPISLNIWGYLTGILRSVVGSQIGNPDVNVPIILYFLHIVDVTIRSGHKYMIGAKSARSD